MGGDISKQRLYQNLIFRNRTTSLKVMPFFKSRDTLERFCKGTFTDKLNFDVGKKSRLSLMFTQSAYVSYVHNLKEINNATRPFGSALKRPKSAVSRVSKNFRSDGFYKDSEAAFHDAFFQSRGQTKTLSSRNHPILNGIKMI